MISQVLDVTDKFNLSNGYTTDMSGWDYAVWQFVSPSGTINITATNDGGAVQGTTDGNATLATNFTTIQATKLSDGTSVTSVGAAGLFKVVVSGRFIKFGGAAAAATKVFIYYTKIC